MTNTTPIAPDLATRYMGLSLAHPFIAGASPLAARLDTLEQLQAGGAAAVVLHSLFEEQITESTSGRIHGVDRQDDPALAPLVAAFPPLDAYPLSADAYIAHIRAAKKRLTIPVIASMNGMAGGAWLRHAELLAEAGADGLEVNFYDVNTDIDRSAESVERNIVSAVNVLKQQLRIPVAVKLSPFFTTFGHFATRLSDAGADALVLFNRFYQPDIDLEAMTAVPSLRLSTDSELPLRLRWLAILSGRVRSSLALTGGVNSWRDGAKAILAGADAVQTTSAVLRDGPTVFRGLVDGLRAWMGERQVASLADIRGRAALAHGSDIAFERASYIRTLYQGTRA